VVEVLQEIDNFVEVYRKCCLQLPVEPSPAILEHVEGSQLGNTAWDIFLLDNINLDDQGAVALATALKVCVKTTGVTSVVRLTSIFLPCRLHPP
jgi:hypothetical protein